MRSAVSLRSTKEAALYFEQVLPLDGLSAALATADKGVNRDCVPYEHQDLARSVFRSLTKIDNADKIIHPLIMISWSYAHMAHIKMGHISNSDDDEYLMEVCKSLDLKLSHDDFRENGYAISAIEKILYSIVSSLGYSSSPIWSSNKFINIPNKIEPNLFELSISGLNLVDTDKLEWEHIIEFRKDPTSSKSLRELRLFFNDNFEGKERSYIEDKLLSLLDRQEAASKLWGFETAQKSLSVAFSNQSTIISSMSGLAAAFGGAPLSVVASAALAFPLANCALEFSKTLIDASKDKIDRPTKFMTKVKDLNRHI